MAHGGSGGRPGLREMTRQAVRAEIAAKAADLFAGQGFENTTVEQIAAEVGMSARSVFRYFTSKEDMVVGGLIELGQEVAAALRQRPAGEPPWTALRRALQVCVTALEDSESGLRTAAMLASTPALRSALVSKQQQWQQFLVPELAGRLGGAGASRELRAQALAASALACLDAAATAWVAGGGAEPLGALLDTAIGAVRRTP